LMMCSEFICLFFFFQAEDGIRDFHVTGVQTCALPISLYGKKVLITAGPTYEAIDPVRFIGNHSSGRMGFALAKHAAALGAEVFLVAGPTALTLEDSLIKVVRVQSAQEMYNATHQVDRK